jgi:N-acetyl-1-D-myo-inositol-2-amino-2-deoxy-alpha-D-glucopyranoside deacetylase
MDKQNSLVAVLAHPDDESFGMGGTLALYAQKGVAIHLICATRGEAGEMESDCLEGYDSIAQRRESELRCAAELLGITSVQFLDYRDSGMSGSPDNQHPQALVNAPVANVAQQIADHIRRLRPQVIITFDPIGGYKHPDHIAIHKATVEAFKLASDVNYNSEYPPHGSDKLYFHLIPKGFLRWGVRFLRIFGKDPTRFGRNQDINLVDLVKEGSFPTHAIIDFREVRNVKDQAALCHASQLDGISQGGSRMNWARFLFGSKDHYMRVEPAPVPGRVERDLFENL